ncbi:MAG: hypothetical protein N2559_11495, partial [Anaerolineae bacterium]|nr:hypothetical protein [Anaerolineae bacterium]
MKRDLWIVVFFIALAALFFAPVLFGNATLIPFDNLFRFPPWHAFAREFGVTTPYNELASDLLLENYAWKQFIVESLRAREIPLWNPYLFAGVPFLAAGQHSALYPFSILFYVLPLDRAFGIFVALQLALAAMTMFAFARVLGLGRFAATISAITYAFSAFFFVSVTFPMVIAAAAWLPAILACAELVIRSPNSARQIFFALVGAIFIGVQFLAGHIEISLYILIVTAFYSAWRVVQCSVSSVQYSVVVGRRSAQTVLILGAMIAVGIALGAVQLVPLYELVQNNFRSGSASYHDVIGWAYPLKQIITFFIPDFFGNPTHHAYVDVFDFTTRAAPNGTIFWGVKNYVEAGSYVGILPLLLALIALVSSFRFQVSGFKFQVSSFKFLGSGNLQPETVQPVTWLFATLALISLLFTFGTPLYAILFFGVPGFNQLHTPFRWVFPYTLSMAVLAGIGAQVLEIREWRLEIKRFNLQSLISNLSIILGVTILLALAASWFARDHTLALADRILRESDMAQLAFDSGRMFYSYQFRNIALFAIFLIGAGITLRVSSFKFQVSGSEFHASRLTSHVSRLTSHASRITQYAIRHTNHLWQIIALIVLIADLFIIGTQFYPRANPRIADFVPPAVRFLQSDQSLYRITSY